MWRRPSCCDEPRWDRSAPAQNAGGAPVTTTAPTPSSASRPSTAVDDLVDHVEGHRVAPVGVVERDRGDPVGDLAPDEAHVGSTGRSRTTAGEWRKKFSTASWYWYSVSGPDRALEAQRLDVGLHRRRPRCSGTGSPASLSRRLSTPRPYLRSSRSSGGRSTPRGRRPDGRQAGADEGQGHGALAADAGHLAPRQEAVAGDVEDAGQAGVEHEQDRADDVVLVHELEAGVEAEHRRHQRQAQGLRQRRDDVGPEHVGEAQQRDGHVRVVDGEVADVALDLEQAALDPAADGRGAPVVLAEPHRVLRRAAVDEGRRLHDHVAHRAARRRRGGEEVHRADDVDLVQQPARHLGGVDDQEGVDDRVDLGGLHDAAEDRVVLVAADVLGALEPHLGSSRSRPTMTSTSGSFSSAWATRPPQNVPRPVTRTRRPTLSRTRPSGAAGACRRAPPGCSGGSPRPRP